MATKVGVVLFPGSNCELDVVEAVRSLGGEAEVVWHGDSKLGDVDVVVLPGGFAHGDYLRHLWLEANVFGVRVKQGTTLVFDLGVYLAVLGTVLAFLFGLSREAER